MKKILSILVVLSSLMTVGAFLIQIKKHEEPATPPVVEKIPFHPIKVEPKEPSLLTSEQAKKTITVAKAKEVLYWLADDAREGRMSGKKGNKEAAEYIKKKFESCGLKTEYQRFNIRRMNPGPQREAGDGFTQNVIGVLPGESSRKIYICSHLDHVGWGPSMSLDGVVGVHPGADDNASGCTGVVACAEAFSKMAKMKHTLIFITFSGEEMGLLGSQFYVESLSQDEIRNIDLMVNFDMIGRLAPKRTCQAIGARRNPKLMDIIQKLEPNYPLKFQASTGDQDNGSDHAPFRNVGVPFIFFFTGTHPQYHRVTDKPDTIDYEGLTNIVQFAFEMIYEYDQFFPRQIKKG